MPVSTASLPGFCRGSSRSELCWPAHARICGRHVLQCTWERRIARLALRTPAPMIRTSQSILSVCLSDPTPVSNRSQVIHLLAQSRLCVCRRQTLCIQRVGTFPFSGLPLFHVAACRLLFGGLPLSQRQYMLYAILHASIVKKVSS